MAEFMIRVRDNSLDGLPLAEMMEAVLFRLSEGVMPHAGAELVAVDGVVVETFTAVAP